MKVEAIDHIHFLVPDLERSRALFCGLAGNDVSARYGGESLNAWAYYHNRGSLDLFEPIDRATPVMGLPVVCTGAIGFALRVADLEAALPEIAALGLRVRSRFGSEEFGFGKVLVQAQLEPEDTLGMMVEVVQRGLPDDPLYCAFPGVVAHLEIHVRDLGRAIVLFEALTGRQFSAPTIDDIPGAITSFCDLGLKIVQPASQDGPVAYGIAHHGEGIRAIAFRTADLDGAVAGAGSLGLQLLRRSPRLAEFHTADFDGLTVKLVA